MDGNHMQQRPLEKPPSYAQSHDPETLHLPSVPTPETDILRRHPEWSLPPLPSVPRDPPGPVDHRYQVAPWPSSNPLAAYHQPSLSHTSPMSRSTQGLDSPSAMDIDIATPDSRGRRGGSVLSMDDPDVRIAAEALGDLRAADFVQSPPRQHVSLPTPSSASFQQGQSGMQQPEPLLSLLTTSHPLLGTAIGGSLSAYSASKNYSPRFKSSAEYVERGLTPVVNTVGSVGRVTGVEGGVRWFLGGRRPSHHQPSDGETAERGSNKRRKVGDDAEMESDTNISRDGYAHYRPEINLEHRERRISQVSTVESLPAYDDQRSPNYEAHGEQALVTTQQQGPLSPGSTWQTRLMLSTSGLSIAMSEESLRSLRYCLSWLRWANGHIGKVINALKELLEQYDASLAMQAKGTLANGNIEKGQGAGQIVVRDQTDHGALSARIAELKSDVLKTLKDVVDVVSRYAGGALPENARDIVRRHLTSLPQRFRIASKTPSGGHGGNSANRDGEVREGAKKVMVLAKEGLDMMAQVSAVLDGTIVSAEEWCERLGRKKRGEPDLEESAEKPRPAEMESAGLAEAAGLTPARDVKMG